MFWGRDVFSRGGTSVVEDVPVKKNPVSHRQTGFIEVPGGIEPPYAVLQTAT